VIDPTYVAATTDAEELFDSQQEFAHTIFNKVSKTDYGRPLVRGYEVKRDSQRIWESLKLCHTDSMISVHRAQQLMRKINSFRTPGTGRTKGIEAHLDEWLDHIHEHDKLTTPVPDDTRLEMLRMITGMTKGLGQLVSTAMMLSGLTTTKINFGRHLQLTMTQAQSADERHKGGIRSRRSQREACTSRCDSEYGNSDLIVDYEEYERAGGATEDQGLCEVQRAMGAPASRSNRPFLHDQSPSERQGSDR